MRDLRRRRSVDLVLAEVQEVRAALHSGDIGFLHSFTTGSAVDGPGLRLYAPKGLEDIAAMVVRPNPMPNYNRDRLLEKARRWQALWPALTVTA